MKLLFSSRRGFTLLEIFIVGAFGILLGTFAIVNLYGWREQKQITAAAQQIATVLREAESRSISQSQGKGWGIVFKNPASGERTYSVFTYTSNSSTTVSTHTLPPALGFNTSTLPVGGNLEVYFDQITGRPRVVGIYEQVTSAINPLSCLSCGTRYCQTWTSCVTRCPVDDPDCSPCQLCTPTYTQTITRVTSTTTSMTLGIFTDKNRNNSSTIKLNNNGTIAFDAFSCVISCVQTTIVLPPVVTVGLGAAPTSSQPGQAVILTWSSLNADFCEAPWTNSIAVSGSQVVHPAQTTNYTMTCHGDSTQAQATITVTVTPPGGGPGGGGPGGGGPMDQPQ